MNTACRNTCFITFSLADSFLLPYQVSNTDMFETKASFHPAYEMEHRVSPRQDALGSKGSCPLTAASAKHLRKTSGKAAQHFQSLSVLASECYGAILKIFLFTAMQPEYCLYSL